MIQLNFLAKMYGNEYLARIREEEKREILWLEIKREGYWNGRWKKLKWLQTIQLVS